MPSLAMLFQSRRRYLFQLLHRAGSRARSTQAQPGDAVLERWLQSWEATPPVSFLPGTEAPTALSWLRRRGPAALPDALLHKLFRQEVVRLYDPSSGRVSRVPKTRQLPPGARLLVPQAALAEAAAGGAPQRSGRGGSSRAASREPTLEQQQLRLPWIRELRRRVLYADADLIAVDKPAGLATQGGSGVEVSVDSIMAAAFDRLVKDPSGLRLVHRLDQATTGVLVVATSPDAAAWLSQGFRSGSAVAAAAAEAGGGAASLGGREEAASTRGGGGGGSDGGGLEVRKTYWAVVAKRQPLGDVVAEWDRAVPDLPEAGSIDLPVSAGGSSSGGSRSAHRGGGWEGPASSMAGALPALTKFTLKQQDAQLAWLELRPRTGRKHQLRIHCAQGLGAPILGDSKYGAVRSPVQQAVLRQLEEEGAWPEGGRPPMFLHCRSVLIKKPGQEAIRIVAPPHPHWEALFRLQRWGHAAGTAAQRAAGKRQRSLKR